ncbi:MAG TPA: response regulator transcription factor [Ktedonobacteraceae bacterium]|nr:response regulator transcription factor [Ktedonobacteraceae bacterium]
MQHNQNDDRSFAAVATETPLANTVMVDTNNGTLKHTKVSALEKGERRGAAKAEKRTTLISVLLVDDHALMREGLRQLLALEQDMKIIGEAVDGYDALQKIRKLRPEVVLMDISMPIVDGLAVTRQITQEIPSLAVIILTMHRQHQQVLQAMKHGARGYLLKSASSQELAEAIRKVHAGGMHIEPELTGAIVSEYRRLSNTAVGSSSITALSEKEVEIIRYVATGMSNKEIADSLAYSEKTVKNYLSIIFQKLGIRDRTQAAIFALRQGLIPEEE